MWYALGGLTLALSVVGWLYTQELEAHGQTKANLEITKVQMQRLQDSIERMEEMQFSLEENTKGIQLELNKARRDLDKFRNREHILVAKPTLVAKRINAAFTKDQEKLACLTGDSNLCQSEK